ncbi:MAG: hypothetical protein NTY38_07290 [Acidobacteria bacterium]|nr:hypothetical protein [Acidobacteriota bacterium]
MFRPRPSAALWLVAIFAVAAAAAPPLSTIQDVLYKADGTRFAGVATIEWTSFQAVDTSNIATHSSTIRIIDGVLSVQLVPTTNASGGAFYNVRYTSDGKVQFSERWAVRPSTTPLKLRDVRISSISSGAASGLASILVADVTGLPQELDLRPVKGSSYTPDRAVVINASGALESVAGNLSDCVRVDGTSGPCGTSGGGTSGTFIDAETPAGNVDGSNAQFTLFSPPSPSASLALHRNGVLQKQGFDYALNNNQISFVTGAVPQPSDVLLASYRSASVASVTFMPVEVLCGATGASTSSAVFTALGTCTIPAGLLAPGDRVEIQFDYSHQGSAAGFNIEVRWGNTVVLSRNGNAGEPVFTGRTDAGISSAGALTSTQSWGGSSPPSASAVLATDSLSGALAIVMGGSLPAGSSDVVTLRNFTVLRYPTR